MNATTYEELVKLIGEERAKPFADQVDDANRTITETGMVTRADPPAETAQPATTDAPVEERQDAPPEKPARRTRGIASASGRTGRKRGEAGRILWHGHGGEQAHPGAGDGDS